ncbi:hypothetical protein A2U01_0042797, partial [Trifolium medium]|nr:hypothetical protein [Trifolium medium]
MENDEVDSVVVLGCCGQ